ncbi:hypothetical protein M2311_003716 [Rhizobium leguminosarum]|uniref:hypothetical protein n=1 Tax=Rhizobium leguminosarum TaxID=384 RepID=UPI00144116C6|nr:hypothetical protein [Rhizobium leguminosarum]MDH6273626.1 hypothetical protein [Rhizobium leguminosarum]NKK01024.1 hypothetical protein [Rhizobium leguminosarum bv. viciae]
MLDQCRHTSVEEQPIADCIRRWMAGNALTERERDLVDDAIFCNRLQMIESVFEDREADHVG